MGFRNWLGMRVDGLILSNLAARLNASPRLGPIYRAAKGYLTWTSAGIGLIAYFAAQVGNSEAAMVVAQVSTGLAGLGLARKGAHLEPPKIPIEMREALQAGMSVLTWCLLTAQGVVYVSAHIGAAWAQHVSSEADFVAFVLTAISGFLATYVGDPPVAPDVTPNEPHE